MGIYIDPTDQTKEDWLLTNCSEYTGGVVPAEHLTDDGMVVCLVNNGAFTAAGVAFSQAELEAFALPDDPRPKAWFRVPVDKLDAVTDGKVGASIKRT